MLRDPWTRIAILFAALPLAAGLVFRTYQYEVTPLWFELIRQLDLFFMLVEIAVIVWARRSGFAYRAAFRALPKDVRWAVILFLTTFWIGSVFVTNFTPYSIVRASLWPVHLLFGAALWHMGGRTDALAVRRIVLLLCAGYLAYLPLLAGYLLSAPEPATLPLGKVIWTSALPGYLSVRHFGIEMGALLAMLLGLVWRDPRLGGAPLLSFTAIMLVGGAICWSGTRGAMFGVAGAVLMTLVLHRNVPHPEAAALTVVALLAGAVISQIALPPDPAFGLFRILPAPPGGDYSSGRVKIWTDAIYLFLERPLTGWGEGSVIWLIFLDGTSFAHPHNMAVQMLESWGAPAALAAFYLIARLWFATHRRFVQQVWLLPVAMAFDALLIMSMADGVFYHARMVMLVALVTTVALKVPETISRSSSAR
jgi:O-antigen ligase